MQTTAPRAMTTIFEETGEVIDADGDGLVVETASGRYRALLAVSCLVRPEIEDTVLLAVPPEGELYVLAVLARPTGLPLRLVADRDLSLQSRGRLRLGGVEGMELRSAGELGVAADSLRVDAVEGTVGVDRLSYVGRFVDAQTQAIRGVLGTLDTFLERSTQHVKRSYRYVEELEVTRAREVDYRAEETFSVRSKNAFVRARELAKVMAAQIHLG